MSHLIKDTVEEFNDTEILISEANSETLNQVIIYLEHYKDSKPMEIYKPIPTEKILSDVTDKWDIEFLEKNKDLSKIKNLIVASEFMGITPLHELVCCHVACLIVKMDSSDEIVKHFGIVEDLTAEEMKKMEEDDFVEQKREREEELKKKKELEEAIALNRVSV